MLFTDRRAHMLCAALNGAIQFEVQDLPLGDVMCTYEDGSTWIAERKTQYDLASSIKNGRWGEQTKRLYDSICKIFYIIEGDLRDTTMPYNALVSATLNGEMRTNTHVIRSISVNETATYIKRCN